ncbi:hypothetical protein ORV05_05345 [Amycolatopsis cynarae]|uniref:Uncharacterized protein n=1 Tax=Amycolatopsis cynarae TaxID=2995223 RepID=A0ABY7B5K6_9PSEU|nr:hypothetical protein [Amycolatopsis sp. HUAS 11-8]WAL67214.1 hypothetical protein ORV05_05345 [Amycolatopsis sp. HUAS 11-8]
MSDDTVTIPRAEYQLLVLDAEAWRLLNESPHVAEILAEWVEWSYLRDLSESTAAMSAMYDWRHEASVPSYAELARRRSSYDTPARTPEQIKAGADYSWRRVEREIAEQHRGAAA